jgi:hypothetical protein
MRPLMPGENAEATNAPLGDLPETVDLLVFGAVALFRDAAGTRWRARPHGQLDETRPARSHPTPDSEKGAGRPYPPSPLLLLLG